MRGEHRAPHLLHAGDRGRRRDRLPLPPRGSWLERADHPRLGQVQKPAGHPDSAGPAEPRGWDPCVLNRQAHCLNPHAPRRGARRAQRSASLCLWAHRGTTLLHVARQKPWSVEEALQLKEWMGSGRRAEGHTGLRMKIQSLDVIDSQDVPALVFWPQACLISHDGGLASKPLPAVALPFVLQTTAPPWRGAVPGGGHSPVEH